MSITMKKPKTLSAVVRGATGFHFPVHESIERLFGAYTEFSDAFGELALNLVQVGHKHLGVELAMPTIPVLGRDIAAKPYDQARAIIEATVERVVFELHETFVGQRVGTVEWGEDGDSCTCSFQEVYRRRGLFREMISRTPHTHVLVRARVRRLDDRDVNLPTGARALIADLAPKLRDELRVVVGTEVVREVGSPEERKRWTPLGEKIVGYANAAAKSAPAAAIAAGAIGAGALAARIASGLAAASVFLADPALVLGDICLIGWEE